MKLIFFQKKDKRRVIYLLLLINNTFRRILDKMTKKEEKGIFEGLILESLPNGMLRVLLDKDDRVMFG